jgi:hypothetical protein
VKLNIGNSHIEIGEDASPLYVVVSPETPAKFFKVFRDAVKWAVIEELACELSDVELDRALEEWPWAAPALAAADPKPS